MDKKVTYAEAILVDEAVKASNALKGPNDLKDPNSNGPARRILVAGNRSGGVAVAAMRRWPGAEVIAHAFDYHHARAVRKRLLDEGLPARNVRCSAGVGVEGSDALLPAEETRQPFNAAFFMTTPQSMPAELVLDQLQDIHANLADGGALYAAFEGDPDEALKTMRLVWKNVNVLKRAKHAVLFKAVRHGQPVKTRGFAATWEASVPGGEPLEFTTYPGCFCHRRPDAGGLALAEVASREVATLSARHPQPPAASRQLPAINCLDMGCGCGLVGLLVADAMRRHEMPGALTLIDSHARAIAAARANAARAGIEAEFILSDDGLPRGRVGEYGLFVGNPPYYSDYRIAEVFLETAYRALKPGGVCLTVVKTATGLLALQEKYFRKAEIVRRRGYCVLRSIR
ncbi:MAG: methyltransferase [Kiritimatiellae bacterium]|nr:methyltransferase [Kiritimatiellia bacterium]